MKRHYFIKYTILLVLLCRLDWVSITTNTLDKSLDSSLEWHYFYISFLSSHHHSAGDNYKSVLFHSASRIYPHNLLECKLGSLDLDM